MKEIWKDIEGYEGKYQISNLGRVKSLNFNHSGFEKIMNLKKEKNGYLRASLFKDGRLTLVLVHRLVAIHFLPNPNNYPIVNHKNEIKTSNFVWVNEDGSINYDKSNLEWCTTQYNVTYSCGKPVMQISKDGEIINIFESAVIASQKTNINRVGISKCCLKQQKFAGNYIWEFYENEKRMAC